MADIMQTDTRTLLRQRIKNCIARLNEYAQSEGSLIPLDWYNYINVDALNVEIPWSCVFGQVFRDVQLSQDTIDKYKKLHGYTPRGSTGYQKGLTILVPASCNSSNEWAAEHGLTRDAFIEGAAYTDDQQWADLTSIWIDEIGKCRLFASTAEGTAIMEESDK